MSNSGDNAGDETANQPSDFAKAVQPAVEAQVPGASTGAVRAENPLESEGLLARFEGEEGRRRLREQLLTNSLVRGNDVIADALMSIATLREYDPQSVVIRQGNSDNDLYLVISGQLSVTVNGRQVAIRTPGTHIGEMSLVDGAALRAATIASVGYSVLAKVPEADFEELAKSHPEMWRRLAIEISRRLHERNSLLRPPREKPVVFIGCSTESLAIAQEIQYLLKHEKLIVQIWTDGVFNASSTPIEDLDKIVREIDFGVVILTPDDKIERRDQRKFGPRDNVIFELGLLVGALGRHRVFMVQPHGIDMNIPSDLTGVNPITFVDGVLATIRTRLGPVCTELRTLFSRLGPL